MSRARRNVRLTGPQKAAALMLTIGKETAAKVLADLPEQEQEQVVAAISQLDMVERQEQQLLMDEVLVSMRAQQFAVRGSREYAHELLSEFHPPQEVERILDRLVENAASTPFLFARDHEPKQVAQALANESPQLVALVLSHFPAGFAASVLAGIAPEKQGAVALRLARTEAPTPEMVSVAERVLNDALGASNRNERAVKRGGVKDLAAILNSSDRQTEKTILGLLSVADEDLAQETRSLMFVFEDLSRLSGPDLEKVVGEVDPGELSMALKGVRADLQAAVLSAVSERIRAAVEDELSLEQPKRRADVERAQAKIVARALELDESGEIIIQRTADADVVV